MEILQSIILGVAQGLGEFLPISSSAHLVLLPWFFEWKDPGLAFDVALHFGTLVAVLAYFWKDIWMIIKNVFSKQVDVENIYPQNMLWFLALATIPGVLAGYFLEDKAETVFRQPLLIAGTLSILGFLLYFADKLSKNNGIEKIGVGRSLIIGISQAVAIVPGVSRSGATITAGLFSGISRTAAARFSFLLSVPIILGATVFKLGDFLEAGIGISEIAGIIAAAVSGYLAIAGLLKFIEKVSYKIFFWYRLALAGAIVLVYFLR